MNLKAFFNQCHKKDVFKMLSIYVVSSWVLLQVLAVTWHPLGLPDKSVTYLIIVLLLCFPIYIFYIWKANIVSSAKEEVLLDAIEMKKKSDFKKAYFSSLTVISTLCLAAVLLIVNNNFSKTKSLQNVVKQSGKIAVLHFGNNTGNPEYDIISKIAADWIMHGITENKAGQVITQEVVNQYANVLKIKNNKEEVNSTVKEYLLPSKIISGNFYLKNNKLLFQCIIKDGVKDETLIAFQSKECDLNNGIDCIDDLKESILGFLMTEDLKKEMLQEIPPKYEAYRYLMEANNTSESQEYISLLNKAIEADSTYFEPKVFRVAYYYNRGDFVKADSLLKNIKPNLINNKRQHNLLNTYNALLTGNNKKVYTTTLNEYEIAPFDLKSNRSTMVVALQMVNRPQDVTAIFNEIKMDSMDKQNCPECLIRIYVKALADIELKKYENAFQLLEPIAEESEKIFLNKALITSYVRSGKNDKLDNFLNKLELVNNPETYYDFYLFTAKEYLLLGNSKVANLHLTKILSAAKKITNKKLLAETLYFKNEFKEAEKLLEELYKIDPTDTDVLIKLAICNLKLGDKKEEKLYLTKLEESRKIYQFGSIDYAFAQFFAIAENKMKMEKHLTKAVAEGHLFTSQTFQNDPHFVKYKDSPSFRTILNYWH